MTPSREGRDNRNRPKDLPSTSRVGSDRRSVTGSSRGSKNNLQELHELYEISSPTRSSRSSSKPSSRPTRKSGSGSSRLANFHVASN
jgi:hypothetical protein